MKSFYHFTGCSIIILLSTLSSCVSNRKITYLQYKHELSEPATISKDAIIRRYQKNGFVYTLQPNDLLDIKISTMTPIAYNPFMDADKNLIPGQMNSVGQSSNQIQVQGYYIDSDGFLELPIIGRMKLSGYTMKQAEDSVAVKVQEYLERPVVRIKLLNFRFSVIGEIDKEALLTTGDNALSLLQAISMAGGPSEYADLSKVKVVRKYENETCVFYVNLLNEEFLSSPFYLVQPNDVIVLTPLKQRSYLRYVSPNLSLLTLSASLLVTIVTLITRIN